MQELLRLIRKLRKKCPWDRKQTLQKIKPLFLNEVYELQEKIDKRDYFGIEEELGDLLLLCLFAVQILKEKGKSNLKKIVNKTVKKIIARHPHIFKGVLVRNVEEVLANWEVIKRAERRKSVVDGVCKILPALRYAELVQERVRRVGFDWSNKNEVLKKVKEEIRELEKAMLVKQKSKISAEFGDLLFALVNLGRHLKISAEESLYNATNRFMKRFKKLEKEFIRQGKDLNKVGLKAMDKVWEKIKAKER